MKYLVAGLVASAALAVGSFVWLTRALEFEWR